MSKYAFRQSPLLLAVGTALASGAAQGATITVTTSADAPPGEITDACTLRAAVASANDATAVDGCPSGSAEADEVVFGPDLAGSTVTLVDGQIEITDDLAIVGPEPNNRTGITIDADQSSRVLRVDGASVELRGLSLSGGRTVADQAGGGGVAAYDSFLDLHHVRIAGNATEGDEAGGGGLLMYDGDVHLHDSIITGNTTSGESSHAGGVRLVASYLVGELSVHDSQITGNSTTGLNATGGGAAINAIVRVHGSTISENASEGTIDNEFLLGGGGLSVSSSQDLLPALVVHESRITSNATMGDGLSGGGVSVNGDAEFFDSEIADNSTYGTNAHGGGIYIFGDAEFSSTTIADNTAGGSGAHGGGVAVKYGDAGLTNSTVSYNSANGSGDGVNVWGDENGGGDLVLAHTTMKYNLDDGVFTYGDLDLFNSIIVQEEGDTACTVTGETKYLNSLATDDSCTGTETPAGAIDLLPLEDNGGPTPTHALNDGSVAIDAAGDCPQVFDIQRDQRGMMRPGPGTNDCDIGAYEVGDDAVFSDRFE